MRRPAETRGRQSAALQVVRRGGGYGGFGDRYISLRVDDHARPVAELARLLALRLGRSPLQRGLALLREGRATEALQVLDGVWKRHPAWSDLAFARAEALLALDRGREALEALEAAVALDPGYPHHRLRAARLLARHGLAPEARDALRAMLRLDREYEEVLRRELEAGESAVARVLPAGLKSLEEPGEGPGGR